jgi:hypothetical protein
MTATNTQSQTMSYSRNRLIQAMFEIAIARLMFDGESLIKTYLHPLLRKKHLRQLFFTALDAEGYCHGRFEVSIDWDKYRESVKVSSRIQGRAEWLERGTPEFEKLLDTFEDLVEKESLTVRVGVSLAAEADAERIRQQLSLGLHTPPPWAGSCIHFGMQLRKANEMSVDLRTVSEKQIQ